MKDGSPAAEIGADFTGLLKVDDEIVIVVCRVCDRDVCLLPRDSRQYSGQPRLVLGLDGEMTTMPAECPYCHAEESLPRARGVWKRYYMRWANDGKKSMPQRRIRRFLRTADGTVKDIKTGLEWLVSPKREVSMTKAAAWANRLKKGGRDKEKWRLPTREELQGLYTPASSSGKDAYGQPIKVSRLFKMTGSWVWSGEVTADGFGYCVWFGDGNWYVSPVNYSADLPRRAMAVRKYRKEAK